MTEIQFRIRVLRRECTLALRGVEGQGEPWNIVFRADLALRVADASLSDFERRKKPAVTGVGRGQGMARRKSGKQWRRFY